MVAEINEPDPGALGRHEAWLPRDRARIGKPAEQPRRPQRRLPADEFDWQEVIERRDPVPSVLELQERFGGRRIAITGGGGSIAHVLATFLAGFRPSTSRSWTDTRAR